MISVEACLLQASIAPHELLATRTRELLRSTGPVRDGQLLDFSADQLLVANLRHVRVSEVPNGVADGASVAAAVYVHQIFEEEAAEEAADDRDSESSVAFQMWTLPAVEFDGLWCVCFIVVPACYFGLTLPRLVMCMAIQIYVAAWTRIDNMPLGRPFFMRRRSNQDYCATSPRPCGFPNLASIRVSSPGTELYYSMGLQELERHHCARG